MCTLIVLDRCVPGKPLVIAANRDEFLARPAEGPAVRMREAGPILAPLDLEAGGTWLGLNRRGVFAGLTNLRPEAAQGVELGARSRGEVVMAALDAGSAQEAVEGIAQLETGAYNPFQLLVADGERAWLTVYREAPRIRELESGVHVVGNVEEDRIGPPEVMAPRVSDEVFASSDAVADADDDTDGQGPRARKLARIRERVEKLLMDRRRDLLEDLGDVCREHVEVDPFESTCVHVADRYGTRSSLLLELTEARDVSRLRTRFWTRLWTTDGPPCERSYEDLSALLGQLDAESRRFIEG